MICGELKEVVSLCQRERDLIRLPLRLSWIRLYLRFKVYLTQNLELAMVLLNQIFKEIC